MVNLTPDMIKLIAILVGGLLVGIIGQIIIIKKRKANNPIDYSQYQRPSNDASQADILSEQELMAKNYIEQYKTSYPRDSIKQGLLQTGLSDSQAESYLGKYM